MLQITHDIFFIQHSYVIIIQYILEWPSSWSTSRIRPSWPQFRVELRLLLPYLVSILPVCLNPPSILLFVPTTQISHSPFLNGWMAQHRRTSKQHSHVTSYTWISISHSYYYSFSLLHFPLGRLADSDSSCLTQHIFIPHIQ